MPPGIYPALFSGSGGISSAAMPDPYVPVDGTMNVTGNISIPTYNIYAGRTVYGNISQSNHFAYSVNNAGTGIGSESASDARLYLSGGEANGASAVATRIAAWEDYTTAGAKIASFGDNAGVSYAEQVYIDKDGMLGFTGSALPPATAFGINANSNALWINAPTSKSISTAINAVEITRSDVGTFRSLVGIAVGGITTVKSAAYTATVADSLVLADPNAAAGSFAVTLPAATAAKGQLLTVKVTATHATRVITVIGAGADTIEGVTAGQTTTTFTTTAILGSATFQSDGTSKWYIIATNGTVT